MQAQQQGKESQRDMIVTPVHVNEGVHPEPGDNRATDEIRLG